MWGCLSSQFSNVKNTALTLLSVIDDLAQPHLNNQVVKRFWNWFFVSHGRNIILSMKDEDLKVIKKGYESLKPIYSKADLAVNIKESRTLNGGKMQKFIESINKEALDLIPDL